MRASPGNSPRFEALDGWRGICACVVILFHFHGHSPLHVFMLMCFVAYETLKLLAGRDDAFTGPNTGASVVSNILLLQSMGVHEQLTWNGPSWSISTEWWSYVLFALVCLWLGLRNWMLAAVAIAAPLLLAAVSRSGMDTTYDWGYARCVFGFALGVACCRIYNFVAPLARSPGQATMTAVELLTVAAVAVFVSLAGTSAASFMAPFVFTVAVLVFAAEGGLVSRVFHSRPLKWLGTVSYSIYLTHFLVVLILPAVAKRLLQADPWAPMALPNGQWVMAFGRNPVEGTLGYVAVVFVTLAFSAVTYRWVEVPGREWTRKWLARPQATPEAVPPIPAELRTPASRR